MNRALQVIGSIGALIAALNGNIIDFWSCILCAILGVLWEISAKLDKKGSES